MKSPHPFPFWPSAAVLTLVLFASFAQADIIGGTEVGPQDPIRSSTVAFYEPTADGRSGGLCTASLIGPHTALTAAHCIDPNGKRPVLVFGNSLSSSQATVRPVTGIRVNPRWQSHQGRGMDQGDLAIVRIGGELPQGYAPVALGGSDAELKKGSMTTLAGYGISHAQRHTGSGVLRKTRVRILDSRPGKSEMILDQTRGHGACHGDSGGPAFIRRGGRVTLAGVTNRGYPNTAPDDCAHQVVYTKVNAYQPWIRKTQNSFERSTGSTSLLRHQQALKHPIRHRLTHFVHGHRLIGAHRTRQKVSHGEHDDGHPQAHPSQRWHRPRRSG